MNKIVEKYNSLYLTFDDVRSMSKEDFNKKSKENSIAQDIVLSHMTEAEYVELLQTPHSSQGIAQIKKDRARVMTLLA